ncbi:unnamed protein product [Phytophthora fragariaefolia]|uniref:Unnamed protein product n=1 Tax=Phytophthora fragariaefolia TaxID=1490495 RepID=A0A9W6TVL0_9STRA|nr:unnamed protein product [Phytophthora fragariaefolia]
MKDNELSFTAKLSQSQPMEVIVHQFSASAVLGTTKINVRVPISYDHEALRAPIPSDYAVVCELIKVNLDFEHMIRSVMRAKLKQQHTGNPVARTSEYGNDFSGVFGAKTILRLVEISPNNVRFQIKKIDVTILDKFVDRGTELTCRLGLSGLSVVLSDELNQELGTTGVVNYPVVTRRAELMLGPLVVSLGEGEDNSNTTARATTLKLDGLKAHVECTLSVEDSSHDSSDEIADIGPEQPVLRLRSTITGENRALQVTLSKKIEPWVASCCLIYDEEIGELLEHDSLVSTAGSSWVNKEIGEWPILDYCEMDVDAQFKLMKTEITLISLDRTCEVLPKGVPSINLTIGEVTIYGHPFVGEENIGVRAKADIQCSRLKASYFTNDNSIKLPFLSIDFARVFISPVVTMMQSEAPAEVEMEAEWIEVKWAPEVLHAIGGLLELGIFTLAPILHETRHPKNEIGDASPDPREWKSMSSLKVPVMHKIVDVTQDTVSPGEVVVFRCAAKRICVTFPYIYNGQRHVECVTVDTFAMSTEGTTERLRISILDAMVFSKKHTSSEESLFPAKPFHKARYRRQSFTSCTLCRRAVRLKETSLTENGMVPEHNVAYFVADCFSIEENKIVGSSKTVVDLFVNGARMEWDISTQLRVMELIRRITYSSWEMIYRARSTYAIHCTQPDSIYNRLHGLNPPVDDVHECLRYERLFGDLISASGDKLHRLHATALSVHAKLCDEVDVQISIGVFAGDDLPEMWIFDDVNLHVNGFEMISAGSVRVRHTINKQSGYVYGEFEDMLRKRLLACKRPTTVLDQNLTDGILIDISSLRLRTSRDFPLQSNVDAIQASFDPYKQELVAAKTSFWRPQNEIFYQFFLRTPVTTHQMEVWLRLENVVCECLGDPLEGWLERMYPVWIEELAEQELRAHLLDDHVATLKLTNPELLYDESYQEMKTLLTEKNARMYIQRVKSLFKESQGVDNGYLISASLGELNVDIAFDQDITKSWGCIQELDEATGVLRKSFKTTGRSWDLFVPSCLLFIGAQLKAVVHDLTVQMRRFPTPLLSCGSLSVGGHIFLTAFGTNCDETFDILPFDVMAAMRCFVDVVVDVSTPVLHFSPGYLYALNELADLALGILPLAILKIDQRYDTSAADIVRRLIHGQIKISVKDAGVRLFCGATSFESGDFLEIMVHQVRAAYTNGSIDIDVTRVSAKVEPGSLSHIAELSHLKLQLWVKWGCCVDPAVHYSYPIEFTGIENTSAAGERFTLQLLNCATSSESYSMTPFQRFQARELSMYISGKICPVDPENGDAKSPDGWSKRDMAARTAIVLYSKNVEWLIGFGRIYQKVPLYPLPRRRSHSIKPILPPLGISSIIKGVTIEEFDLIGLDLALYASEKHPVGIRAFLDDKISCSGAFLKSSHELFANANGKSSPMNDAGTAVRRLSFAFNQSIWVVHDVNVDARDIQVRICTPESGSRGESLVSVKNVSLVVGGGAERAPTHDNGYMKLHSPPPMKRIINAQPRAFSDSIGEASERTKQSILDFFDIPHENPFSYRESDSDAEGDFDVCNAPIDGCVDAGQDDVIDEFRQRGFLLGLLSNEVRVTVTMTALASLVDIVDTWVQVIVACLPDPSDTAEAMTLLEQKDYPSDSDIVVEESDPSPKKFTSLAQDPKFSGICLQAGAEAPVSRTDSQRFEPTPYSNADTVRPTRRKSSKVLSPLEPLRSTKDITSQETSSKIVHAFIMVKFEDCQISIQDHFHKGSVLLALNAGTLQHASSTDTSHERINLNVDGLQLFSALLDVDVKSHAIWLKTLADGSYSPSSYGLLRQIIAPIPAQVTIWIDREKAFVKNRVKLDIPSIEVQVNPVSKSVLEKLATTATELINAKLADKKESEHSHLLHGYLRDTQHQGRSLHQLVALKKQLKWKIAALQWRQLCGWDYRMNERAMVAVTAAENARNLSFHIETSPLFRRRKMSSASMSSATTGVSMVGSTATNRYEDDQFTDELHKMTQHYQSICEMTRFVASEISKQLKPSPLPNVDLEFALDCASLKLSGDNVDILRAQMGALCFKMQLFEDHSGNFALTLQDLSISNLSPGTPYPDLLLPVYSRTWEGDDMFLRVDADVAKPVGGITVVQHFEVNVHPIQVCITQEVIMQLVGFFSPSDTTSVAKEEQRAEVRSQFLQARTASTSSSDGRVGSAIIKAVKVAGKAAAHPLTLGRTHRGDSDEDTISPGRKTKGGSLHNIPEDPSQWLAKLANLSESDELPLFGSTDESDLHQSESAEREISAMKVRAKNILFKRIRLGAIEVVLTYKNKKSALGNSNIPHLHLPHAAQPQALEDMRGFEVKTHALVYCDKTCSPLDLVMRMRRDILLNVLSQVGRNFTNIGNFLRDQFDPSRWAAFDGLAPLKSLSTTVSSLTAIGPSHIGAVLPSAAQPEDCPDAKAKHIEDTSLPSASLRSTELLHEWQAPSSPDLFTDHYDADSSTPTTPTSTDAVHPKQQVKAKRSLAKLFSRKKSSGSLPSPSPVQQKSNE